MKVTILGSGTIPPSLEKCTSGLLIRQDGIHTLVDLGYGVLRQLLKLNLTHHDIDRVFFTHNHPDHVSDLVMFLFTAKYSDPPRTKPLEIVGAPGFEGFFSKLTGAFQHWLQSDTYALTLTTQDEETRAYDTLKVTSVKVEHIELSRAYRFENAAGKTFAVSGDTDYCENMAKIGREVDLLILECSFPDNKKVAAHLTPRLAGRIAREAGCLKLCLTHLYPACNPDDAISECAKEFDGEIVLAQDLMEFTL